MNRASVLLLAGLLTSGCGTVANTHSAAFQSDRITVTIRGTGPDVVLVPGLVSSATDVWSGTVTDVPGYRYHIVQVHGFAGVPADGNAGEGPVVQPIAEEIARYIQAAGLKRPAVIGHSMGGSLAMTVAVRHPGLVSRLMIVDMVPFMGIFFGQPGTVTHELARAIAERTRTAWLSSSDEAWRRRMETSLMMMIRTDSARASAIEKAAASDRSVAARAMYDLIVQDLRSDLSRVTVPITVLYVHGPHVPLTEEQTDAIYRESFVNAPHAKLRRIRDAYHCIMLDQPQRFADEVRAFLRQ